MQTYPVYPKNILLANKRDMFVDQLANAKLNEVIDTISKDPEQLTDLVGVLNSHELEMHVRIGVSAVLEAFAGHPAMVNIIPALTQLTQHQEVHLRSDACYFLGLTQHESAKAPLEQMLNDPHPEVRSSAQEALEDIA